MNRGFKHKKQTKDNVKLISVKDVNKIKAKDNSKNNLDLIYEKSQFLLSFDYDPEAQKQGLRYLRKLCKLGYKPALDEVSRIKKNNLYKVARDLYKFVYGQEII